MGGSSTKGMPDPIAVTQILLGRMRCTPAETKSVGRNGRCSFPLQTNDSESRYVPCQWRGEEDGGGRREEGRTTGRTRAGEVTLRRKDSLSMQKNVVNTTNPSSGCRSSTWGRTASSFPDTSRHCESEKKKRGGVMEMSPLKSLHLSTRSFSLSRIIILLLPSHTPTYCTPTGSRVAAKKGLCRRGRAAGTLAPPAAATASHICRRHATWPLSALFSSFCVGLQI